jgi:hypothetical protein
LIVAELAEPYQEDEELRRQYQQLEQSEGELRLRNQELENVQNRAVKATVIVENSGGGDHDQNAASSPFGRKEKIWIALALLLVVGVILGVAIAIPLTTNNDKDSSSIDSAVTPTQSPTLTKASTPPAAPPACTSMDCRLAKILLQNGVMDAEALQDDSSPQFRALRWLATEDTALLDLDSTSTVILVERYVLAVLYFATNGEGWEDQQNFLSASSVCEWNNGHAQDYFDFYGAACNGNNLVAALILSKSTHEEAIVLISKFCFDSPVSLPFYFNSL